VKVFCLRSKLVLIGRTLIYLQGFAVPEFKHPREGAMHFRLVSLTA